MGITNNCAKFLFHSKRMGVSFENTIMLGRQQLYAKPDVINQLVKKSKLGTEFKVDESNKYAEPLFKVLGASKIDSLDFSDYEQATFIHDLNLPIPENLKNQYTVVFDGGTLEHVFNFPTAITNCMNMLKTGGYFISITPANNQCGHGFYQFSPELYFSLFNESRGFRVKSIFLAIDINGKGIRDWYSVKDPSVVNTRVTISNCSPTYLLILSEKIKDVPFDTAFPFQSDYMHAWQTFDELKNDNPSSIKRIYKKIVPKSIRDFINKFRSRKSTQKSIPGLGNVNPDYFQKVEVE